MARLTKDGKWRVAYQEPKDMTYQEIVDNQPAHFERILPGNPKPGDYTVTNLSPYRLHQRCAEKFRVGRICLGGDAAHLCNPWGGLGLTGGFGDVMGLADCLAGIATGQADDSILDKYDQVRKSIFLNVVDPISTANFLRITTLASEEAIQKDPFFKMCEAATRDPQVQEKIQKVGVSLILDEFVVLTIYRACTLFAMTLPNTTALTSNDLGQIVSEACCVRKFRYIDLVICLLSVRITITIMEPSGARYWLLRQGP